MQIIRWAIRPFLPCLAVVCLAAFSAGAADIRGTVTDAETGVPLPATQVLVRDNGGTEVASTATDAQGCFHLTDLSELSFTLVVSRLSYESQTIAEVRASRLGDTLLAISLVPSPLGTDVMVVTASRQREQGLGAPASTTVLDLQRLAESTQLTPLDLAREVTGVDFASKGLIQHTLSMRGIRWTHSIKPLLMTDYRNSSLPMSDIIVPYTLQASSDDVERIEVARGPASALYGPNSEQGVMHIITRSPFDSPGTMISVMGGERGLQQGTFRHAAILSDRVAFKISGRYLQGNDWEYIDPVEQRRREEAIAAGADPETLLIGKRDFRIQNGGGEARLDWRIGSGTTAILTGGFGQAINLVDLNTVLAGVQLKNWQVSFVQGRLMSGRLMANIYYNFSDSGDTYALRTGLPFRDNSGVVTAQVQHGTELGSRHQLLYGLDARHTEPRTHGTLHGRYEDNDTMTEMGAYLNTTTLLTSRWDLVAALRVDYHDRINDLAISPRLGAIFRPTPSHALRLTWNRAFNSPTAPEIFLDFPMGSVMPGMGIQYVGFPKDGFTFSRSCEGGLCMRSPLHPAGVAASLPTDATLLWPAVVQIMSGAGIDLSGLPAPDASQVGTDLRALDLLRGEFTIPMDESDLTQTRALSRIYSNTYELGYKGWLGKRAYLGVDVYRIDMENYYGEAVALNPNVFLDQEDLQTYLEEVGGLATADAAAVAAAAAGIPLGTVVPDDQPTADVLLVNHMGGSYTNWGVDLTIELSLSSRILLTGYYSWLDKNVVFMPEVGEQIFSVPRNKGAVGLAYRNPVNGLDARIQGRAIGSFPVQSGVLAGNIESYTVLDVGLGYRLSWSPETRVSIDALNVLDNRHQEWPGAPDLGRLVVTRLQVNF